MKPLPMKLWIGIEDDVIRHKAEVAQSFAEAKARLLPDPSPLQDPMAAYRRGAAYLQQALMDSEQKFIHSYSGMPNPLGGWLGLW